MLQSGLYEQIISKFLKTQLDQQSDKFIKTALLEEEESPRMIAKYLSEVIENGLHNVKDHGKDLQAQLSLANKLIDTLVQTVGEKSLLEHSIDEAGEMLLALLDKKNKIYAINDKAEIQRPVTSLAESSLFTGAGYEPSMFTELKREIVSCDRIDMLVSFIKWSGLRLIIDELRSFTEAGGKLRVITTSYLGATDLKAIEELRELPNTEIKISYDTKRTRLHAKAYVFYRNTGFITAYIGSSNLSNSALSSGLEWNVKATAKDLPDIIQKIEATFESYWYAKEFEVYTSAEIERLAQALKKEKYLGKEEGIPYLFDLTPFSYQQEILDRLNVERKVKGYYRNLIVAATGTGKTVISAFDYLRYRKENKEKPCRLLFVAHREEILKQSLACFRGVLKDANFGELYVGNYKPESIEHLFISIQTFNSCELDQSTSPDFYDFIIVDEFHHAAAPTYQKLLTYYMPKILLGLTATPERMDGKSILKFFDQRIAAEIRLPEAIGRKLLSPFQYFGVTDQVDLNSLKWSRGGYDKSELSKVYTENDLRVSTIVKAIRKYTTDLAEIKGLGFCVCKEHAEYMARSFNRFGILSMFLISDSSDEDRNSAKKRLVDGEIRFIFVVDLYNEGVDIPEVNTILFLRPTESLTVFLQQLGRGLRLAEDKECLTVLDFIGQANKKYDFEDKFTALLNNTKSVQREIKEGFTSLPKGCYIQLERKAKDYILDNIRSSYSNKTGLIARIANFTEDTGLKLNLPNFLGYYHLEMKMIYKAKVSFSRYCVLSHVITDFDEPLETIVTKALGRISAIDSRRWISFLLEVLSQSYQVKIESLSESDTRMLQMFHFTIWQKTLVECGFSSLEESLSQLRNSPVMLAEIIEVLRYNYDHIDLMDEQVDLGFDSPLDLHCTYTRDQILVAMDFMKPATVREGVKFLPEKKIDVFFITLNKSDKDYSPSTMYQDYSINERLFHWQSQSTTSADSTTGQRYINHKVLGSKVLLFVREYKNDQIGTAPYTFLGLADYVQHEGSRPMNITWRLHRPIPAKYSKITNKLIVG
ncbi:DEAD/DEAH box helicase [Desulfitobacterium metallireducens]|uniref:Helicase n=1 Tax=Desulfitobacterium metallireducens DSM 15288 TaxID=871968 RepID=W0E821_9FIRM|nr:DEAD/DEAH box helicase [Desulfitobacterium metallireducens]AHF07015.1 helicase [Desulfitobacterium metallireducens DSM 15288]